MIQPWRQLRAQFLVLRRYLLRDFFQRIQMRRRVPVPERMISDEIDAALQEIAEMSVIGHVASMECRRAVGKERGPPSPQHCRKHTRTANLDDE